MKTGIQLILLILFFNPLSINAQSTFQFSSVDSLFKLAEKNSSAMKINEQQRLSAKWTKIASLGNTVNLKSPFSASWTDNTTLPVSYLPGEIFGGPAGSFKAVSLGQQYVTSYAVTPQIDIINPSAWARIKSAELNKQLTEVNNLLSKKNLFESIAASYYNVVSIQYQIKNLEQGVIAADSILLITKNKFGQGIIREQDMNNAQINLLTITDRLAQLKLSLDQNYNSLKILCDIKMESTLQITESLNVVSTSPKASPSLLSTRQAKLQSDYAKNELTVNRLNAFSPTLSVIFNQTWQQNSNLSFSDANASKFTAQYIGLRFTMPFPLDITRLSTNYTSKINYRIAHISSEHSELQSAINDKQLDLEYQKSNSNFTTSKQIYELKEINFQKTMNQYKEGIISTDLLLTAFTDKINAGLNYSAAFAGLKYNESKININNTIK